METNNTFQDSIRTLIANDELGEAIQQLQNLLNGSPALTEVLVQSARFNDIMQQIRLNVVDYEKANMTKNQIRMGLLQLLDEMDAKGKDTPAIQQELERQSAKTVIQNAEKIYNIEKIDKADFS